MAGTPAETTQASFPRQGSTWKPLPKGADGKRQQAHTVQTIRATPEAIFNLYTRVEALPIWQDGVVSVERTSPGRLHWKMQDLGTGKQFAFDSEEVEVVAGKRHVARVTSGPTAGTTETLTLEPHPSGRGTVATLVSDYVVPGAWLTNKVAAVISRSPAQVTIENLRNLKELLEAGEIPNVEGQPAGRRGISGKLKQLLYGETMPTPPGTSGRAKPEDLPQAASEPSRTALVLASLAGVAILGTLLYFEGRDD